MTSPARIAVIDYGMGNRRSVQKALEHVGASAEITNDHARLAAADGLVLPGVGAFPLAMHNLNELGLADVLRAAVDDGRPLLGICLGMQLLFERSEEIEPTEGLGLIGGVVTPLRGRGLRIPHIGWNDVRFVRRSPLTEGLPPAGCAFYHVHSLASRPSDDREVCRDDHVRRNVRDRMSAQAPCSASSFTPRSLQLTACGCSRASSGSVGHAPRRLRRSRRCADDPASCDRHPRRQGCSSNPR